MSSCCEKCCKNDSRTTSFCLVKCMSEKASNTPESVRFGHIVDQTIKRIAGERDLKILPVVEEFAVYIGKSTDTVYRLRNGNFTYNPVTHRNLLKQLFT